MNTLFAALESRFNANTQLVGFGRKLYEGQNGLPRQSGPHTCVDMVLSDRLDTFTSDIEVYDVEFTFFSASVHPDDCRDWLENVIDVFETANLTISGATNPSTVLIGQNEPSIGINNTYWASSRYRIVVQRNSLKPATRGA